MKNFKIKEIYVNAITQSRKLKPEFPLKGLNNIEIRDEIELEKIFSLKFTFFNPRSVRFGDSRHIFNFFLRNLRYHF